MLSTPTFGLDLFCDIFMYYMHVKLEITHSRISHQCLSTHPPWDTNHGVMATDDAILDYFFNSIKAVSTVCPRESVVVPFKKDHPAHHLISWRGRVGREDLATPFELLPTWHRTSKVIRFSCACAVLQQKGL